MMFSRGFRLQVMIIVSLIISFILGVLVMSFGSHLASDLTGFLSDWYSLDSAVWNTDTYHLAKHFTDMKGKDVFQNHAAIWLFAAIVIVIYSIVGLLAILTESLKLLQVCIYLSVFSLLSDYIFFAEMYNLESWLNMHSKDYLFDIMRESYLGDKDQKKYWNSIMIMGECCGVYGPGDFHFNGDNNGTGDTDELNRMWPLACCKRETLSKTGHLKNCFSYVDHDEVLQKVNSESCYNVLYDLTGVNMFHFVVLLLFSIVQLLQITMFMLLDFYIDLLKKKPPPFKSTPGSSAGSRLTSANVSRQVSTENLDYKVLEGETKRSQSNTFKPDDTISPPITSSPKTSTPVI